MPEKAIVISITFEVFFQTLTLFTHFLLLILLFAPIYCNNKVKTYLLRVKEMTDLCLERVNQERKRWRKDHPVSHLRLGFAEYWRVDRLLHSCHFGVPSIPPSCCCFVAVLLFISHELSFSLPPPPGGLCCQADQGCQRQT